MIDWGVAQGTATKLSRPGPDLSPAEADDVVGELREAAARSTGPVREFSDLHAPDTVQAQAPVLVVDRPRWIEANLGTFEVLMDPVVARIEAGRPRSGLAHAVGSRVSGAEIGGLVALLSGKVLGQFDPFWTLWVCLHEETHRVQFTAVPWMRDHLRGLIDELTAATDLDSEAVQRFLTEGVGELVKVLRGTSDASLAELFQNERQKAVVDRITGVMSLLEGHADVVMDGVGPDVIPSVATIRKRFDQRRQGGGGLDRVLRRLLGLESKMRQYRDGAVFVREVNEKVGLSGFNAVWERPENLPDRAEILDPAAWVARVHG
ncbi:MAG: coenzyme F420 biosynthesis-associated protein [Actinomycetales bacterium]|nr:MAG: coenzyme F420 biosynthesis-associated protein [Actinomycetales bacterium]